MIRLIVERRRFLRRIDIFNKGARNEKATDHSNTTCGNVGVADTAARADA